MSEPNVGSLRGEAEYPIFNEFARVVVRKVYTRNGERLEIRAPHFEAVVHLDPLQLECLARRDVDLLLKLLPGDDDEPAPGTSGG